MEAAAWESTATISKRDQRRSAEAPLRGGEGSIGAGAHGEAAADVFAVARVEELGGIVVVG